MLTTLWRSLACAPLLSVTVIVLVASIVAVNATAFSSIHALRWKALPYAEADRLVDLRADLVGFGLKVGLTERLRGLVAADTNAFDGALGFVDSQQPREDEQGRRWQLARVGQEFTTVLGVAPTLGRGFLAEDMHDGADGVLIISDAAWRRHFDSARDATGRSIRFDDRTYTVIGVMPPGFIFPTASVDAWRPYVMTAGERAQSEGGNVGDIDVVARLAADVTPAQAGERLQSILAADPTVAGLRENGGLRSDVRAWRERFAGTQERALALVQLAALVLLASVAANLVNLFLDRLLGRAREFAIRRVLGADERTITLGIVADVAPPVIIGLAAGLALTPFGIGLSTHLGLLPDDLPQGTDFGMAAIAAGIVVAVIALASAAAAAWLVRRPAMLSSRAGTGGLGRVRPMMIVAQVMLTTVLLGASGLMLRSALNLMAEPRGFDALGVVLTSVDPAGVSIRGETYDPKTDEQRLRPIVESVRSDIAALPGVGAVAVAMAPPFSQWEFVSGYAVPGQGEQVLARARGVGVGYFAALDIPVVAGRGFERGDNGDEVVVIDERWASRYFADSDPIGASINIPQGNSPALNARVIGVARTVKHERLDEDSALPTVYQYVDAPLPVFWLVTRVAGEPADYLETIRQRIRMLVPGVDIGVNQPLEGLIAETLVGQRSLVAALGAFAIATLVLAALGLAAVLGFAIRRRTGEIGVRMAMGATPARVGALVLRQGGGLVATGVALGVGIGIVLAKLLAERLHGIGIADPLTWSVVTVMVVAIALLACWMPARRAARTDPMVALRSE